MTRTPPSDASLEQALAYGIEANRTPTAAHPDCVCGKPTGVAFHTYTWRDCPMHGPKKTAPAAAATAAEATSIPSAEPEGTT